MGLCQSGVVKYILTVVQNVLEYSFFFFFCSRSWILLFSILSSRFFFSLFFGGNLLYSENATNIVEILE